MATVEVRAHPGWVELVLSNRRYRNCMTHGMWAALEERCRTLAVSPDLRAVVIRGEGEHFTSGFDLSELAGLSYADVNAAFALVEGAISAVETVPVPVIAALRGYCLGGGLELALACDLRLADETVRMGMPVARIGIMLSPTFALRLVKVLGPGKAKEMFRTSEGSTRMRSGRQRHRSVMCCRRRTLTCPISWTERISVRPSAASIEDAAMAGRPHRDPVVLRRLGLSGSDRSRTGQPVGGPNNLDRLLHKPAVGPHPGRRVYWLGQRVARAGTRR